METPLRVDHDPAIVACADAADRFEREALRWVELGELRAADILRRRADKLRASVGVLRALREARR